MAAPVTTTRVTPVGRLLKDGHSTKVAHAKDPDVSMWEVTVKPPGLVSGGRININHMHRSFWRAFAAGHMSELSNYSGTCFIDPNVYNNFITNLLHQEGSITVREPDGSTLDFFGCIDSLEPGAHTEHEAPIYDYEGFATNTDPSDGSEAGPVLTSVSGT